MSGKTEDLQHTPPPLAAMQMLIRHADDTMAATRQMAEIAEMSDEERAHNEKIEVAISVVNAMLNTALPIARWRCFVQIDKLSVLGRRIKRTEFTICAVDVEAVVVALQTLSDKRYDVYVQLWEQKPLGAEMMSGYQGPSKINRYQRWLDSLDMFHDTAMTQD